MSSKNYMIKKTTKIAIFFLAGLLIINTFGSLAYAAPTTQETDGVYDQNGNLKIGECIKRGGIDFKAFLAASLWSDSFLESIVEPWKDVLVRNACHAFDMYGLVQQRDKLRKQIRDAFLTCRNEKVPKLKKAYYKTVVEIGFARNIVKVSKASRVPQDMDKLLTQLEGKYVGQYHWFNKDEFSVFKNVLKVIYQDRISDYIDTCDQGSWAAVLKKFKEFHETVIQGGFVDDIKKAGAEIKRKAQKVKESFGDAASWEEWGKGLLQVNLNGTPCTIEDPSGCGDFWKEFTGEFNENNPFNSTNFPTTSLGVYETRKWSDLGIRSKALKDEMSSRFQMLYGVATDAALDNFIKASVDLNTSIKDSFKPLNGIKECLKTINKRQCS